MSNQTEIQNTTVDSDWATALTMGLMTVAFFLVLVMNVLHQSISTAIIWVVPFVCTLILTLHKVRNIR